jgi:hypothetical protein
MLTLALRNPMTKATLNKVAQFMVNVVQGARPKLLEFRVGILGTTLNSTFCHDKTKVGLAIRFLKPYLKRVQGINSWFQDCVVFDPHNLPKKDNQYICTICNQS